MKLLLDQNRSYKLVKQLQDVYPGTAHVRELDLHESDDPVVWQYARDNDFLLVSKDSDVMDLCMLRGAPPKLVWLRLGNCSTTMVEEVLRRRFAAISALLADPSRIYISVFRYQKVE